MSTAVLTWKQAAALDPTRRSVKYLRALCKRLHRQGRLALVYTGEGRKCAKGIPLAEFERLVARGTLAAPPCLTSGNKSK